MRSEPRLRGLQPSHPSAKAFTLRISVFCALGCHISYASLSQIKNPLSSRLRYCCWYSFKVKNAYIGKPRPHLCRYISQNTHVGILFSSRRIAHLCPSMPAVRILDCTAALRKSCEILRQTGLPDHAACNIATFIFNAAYRHSSVIHGICFISCCFIILRLAYTSPTMGAVGSLFICGWCSSVFSAVASALAAVDSLLCRRH